MAASQPTKDQLDRLLSQPMDKPVVMVNLLKFKDKATYEADRPEAKENLTGFEAYMRYGVEVSKILEKIGAKQIYAGPVGGFVIGDGDWDMVALVRYPSRQAFLEMTPSEAYQAIHYHRDAGLSHQDLIETLPADAG